MKPLDAVALIAGGVVSVAQFVLFVFVCMALKQSDTESLTNACGYILRDLLRFCVGLKLSLNTVGVFVMALIAHLAARFYGPEASPIHTVLILLYFCCTCVLDAWILYESWVCSAVLQPWMVWTEAFGRLPMQGYFLAAGVLPVLLHSCI